MFKALREWWDKYFNIDTLPPAHPKGCCKNHQNVVRSSKIEERRILQRKKKLLNDTSGPHQGCG